MTTSKAPAKSCRSALSEIQAKLVTKAGIPSGTAASTAQMPRPGSRVRSTSQAVVVPITAQATVVAATSVSVLTSSSPTSGRNSNCAPAARPTPEACTTV